MIALGLAVKLVEHIRDWMGGSNRHDQHFFLGDVGIWTRINK
jgi:hypothetical protein